MRVRWAARFSQFCVMPLRAISLRLHPCIVALALLLPGCTRGAGPKDWQIGSFIYCLHGHIDFAAPPTFEIGLGSYRSIMCFDHSTVFRVSSGTYVSIELPYYALLAGCVALVLIPVVFSRLRKRRKHDTAA
jgi:hypothetical protein